MAVFFTADTHFGHGRIIELCDRPFGSLREMDEALVARWREVVTEDDTVYHLGDLALGNLTDSLAIAATLPGRKLLVPGNHDRVSSVESEKRRERFHSVYEDAGFEVLPEQYELELNGVRVRLCHYPPSGDSHGEDRARHLRPPRDGMPLLHGHTHQHDVGDGHWIHVGVDGRDFAPVSADQILLEIRMRREMTAET